MINVGSIEKVRELLHKDIQDGDFDLDYVLSSIKLDMCDVRESGSATVRMNKYENLSSSELSKIQNNILTCYKSYKDFKRYSDCIVDYYNIIKNRVGNMFDLEDVSSNSSNALVVRKVIEKNRKLVRKNYYTDTETVDRLLKDLKLEQYLGVKCNVYNIDLLASIFSDDGVKILNDFIDILVTGAYITVMVHDYVVDNKKSMSDYCTVTLIDGVEHYEVKQEYYTMFKVKLDYYADNFETLKLYSR